MAFIEKTDPVVLNIMLTSKGREQLSKGKLTFSSFAIGDSEIDYSFNSEYSLNPFNANVLRPMDKNPNILSFITKDYSGTTFTQLDNISSVPSIIENSTNEYGFFNVSSGSTTTLCNDLIYVRQPDAVVKLNEINGGTSLRLYKSSAYGINTSEPKVGDIILIKWGNPNNISSNNLIVDSANPTPYLFYKIDSIFYGNLNSNTLTVNVDRNLPNFTSQGVGATAQAIIYYGNYNISGNTYSTDFIKNNLFSFFENSANISNEFPYWKMSIIFTEEIAGVTLTNRKIGAFKTNTYNGFVSYIQNQAPIYKKLGVIHYTNPSPSNTYGEGLYLNTPLLKLPTIMWHNKGVKKMGLVLSCLGSQKLLTGVSKSLNTYYYDLSDENGYVVGKVFNELKLFVIEDQELLFAMSYKSNRNWTLPKQFVGFGVKTTNDTCQDCLVTATINTVDALTMSGNGSIVISSVTPSMIGALIFAEIKLSGSTTSLYFDKYIGVATIPVPAGTYIVNIYDMSSSNCYTSKTVVINNPTSILEIENIQLKPR